MKKLSGLFGAVIASMSFGAAAATLTAANIDVRTTSYVMNFSDLSFAGAFNQRADALAFHGSVGDSGTFGIAGFPEGYAAVSVVAASGMAISNQQPANASGVVTYTTAIVGTTHLSITQSWNNTGTLTHGVSAGGLHYLEFFAPNRGFLRTGGVFDFAVYIPGNWSVMGTSTGQLQYLGVNPQFSVIKSFVYDAANDRTVFQAVDSNYTQVTSDVHFVLYGSPVPEPASWSLLALALALGLLGLRTAARRTALPC